MSKQLKLKNYFFVNTPHPNPLLATTSLQLWLTRLMLHGQVSRFRTRFVKLLDDRINEIDKERIKMLTEAADKKKVKEKGADGKEKEVEKVIFNIYDKDELGNPKIDPATGKPVVIGETLEEREGNAYKISDEKNKKFEEEWKKYLDEILILDVTPATQDTIYGARDIIMKTNEEFRGRMSVLYDEWCEAFENINESKKSESKGAKEPKE